MAVFSGVVGINDEGRSDENKCTSKPLMNGVTHPLDMGIKLPVIETPFAGLSRSLVEGLSNIPKAETLANGVVPAVSFCSAAEIISQHLQKCQPLAFQMSEITASINSFYSEHADMFEKIRSAAQKLNRIAVFLDCCKKTEWPIFLDSHPTFEEEIADMATSIVDEDELRAAVTEAVLAYYADSKLREMGERWSKGDLVSVGQLAIISEALRRHMDGDYLGSTTLLMCLFEGLVTRFYQVAFDSGMITDEDYDFVVKQCGSRRRPKKDPTARTKVFSLAICTETGALYWNASSEYISDIVLSGSGKWEELAESNPLRNKICHGEQTNHGTVIHSLKAILATDLILRLGTIVRAASLEEGSK